MVGCEVAILAQREGFGGCVLIIEDAPNTDTVT